MRSIHGLKEDDNDIDSVRCLSVFYAEHNNEIEGGLLGTWREEVL